MMLKTLFIITSIISKFRNEEATTNL